MFFNSNRSIIIPLLTALIFSTVNICAQDKSTYWNDQTMLTPRRLPLPDNLSYIKRIDLDQDGDPDVLRYTILNGIPVMWIDDNDNMTWADIEGDLIDDCLCVDRDRNNIYSGPMDICIDWNDNDDDGVADMQFVVENGSADIRNKYDWNSNMMIIIDDDQDGVFKFIDWNTLRIKAWEHNGHSNFFTDYQGNVLFTKISASSFRISDLRYSWENPFIFWDTDNDGLSEVAMRMMDAAFIRDSVPTFYMSETLKNIVHKPGYRTGLAREKVFSKQPARVDIVPSGIINYVAMSWDLDNDNGQGNQFDFDMSLSFEGEGFNYKDQVNKFHKMRGLQAADSLLFDASWRQFSELVFPNRSSAHDLTFNRGKWQHCYFIFDEDDDCNRWERVEFYEPKDIYKIGAGSGGLDQNPQADAVGDRAEFDLDFSGKGNLYLAPFDGKIHLLGAEWGAWRIDQKAYSFQGFGGLYDSWNQGRLQSVPAKFGVVKYLDTDSNGFIDEISYDLDGDMNFEETISLSKLGIDDKQKVYNTSGMKSIDYESLFEKVTQTNWDRAQKAIELAHNMEIDTGWYSFWKNPRTLHERYDYGYWLNFYIYNDLRQLAKSKNDFAMLNQIDKAYYSGDWNIVKY